MTPPAERQMLSGVFAADIEAFAVGELISVPITRAKREQQSRPGGKVDSADRDRLLGHASPLRHRRIKEQALLNGVRNQLRLSAKRLPLTPVFEQCAKRTGRRVGGGLMTGENNRERHGG